MGCGEAGKFPKISEKVSSQKSRQNFSCSIKHFIIFQQVLKLKFNWFCGTFKSGCHKCNFILNSTNFKPSNSCIWTTTFSDSTFMFSDARHKMKKLRDYVSCELKSCSERKIVLKLKRFQTRKKYKKSCVFSEKI